PDVAAAQCALPSGSRLLPGYRDEAEVADRRADRTRLAVQHEDPPPAPARGKRHRQSDDARADHREVEASGTRHPANAPMKLRALMSADASGMPNRDRGE